MNPLRKGDNRGFYKWSPLHQTRVKLSSAQAQRLGNVEGDKTPLVLDVSMR
jgi:hypothetical protein